MKINPELCAELISPKFRNPEIKEIVNISDGLSKSSYKLRINNQSFVLQIWKEPVSLFNDLSSQYQDFIYAGTVENLLAAEIVLGRKLINTPKIILEDRSREKIGSDFVLFEYVDGSNILDKMESDFDNLLLKELATIFARINKTIRNYPGLLTDKVNKKNPVDVAKNYCFQELENASLYNKNVKRKNKEIVKYIEKLTDLIPDRDVFHLVHGDFNPNHFLVNHCDEIYMLDIDGMKYLDIEFEISQFCVPSASSFNRPEFHDQYSRILDFEFDDKRLSFYKIYHSILATSYYSERFEKMGQNEEDFLMSQKYEEVLSII